MFVCMCLRIFVQVKPKVDPLGMLNPNDYTTSLRVSAHGVSVCVPDAGATQGSYSGQALQKLGTGPEKEVSQSGQASSQTQY